MRTIKFRVYRQNKLIGLEELRPTGWYWRCFQLDPDKGERWTPGIFPNHNEPLHQRVQFTGLLDREDKEIYSGAIVEFWDWEGDPQGTPDEIPPHAVKRTAVMKWNHASARFHVVINVHRKIIAEHLLVIGHVFTHPELIPEEGSLKILDSDTSPAETDKLTQP